MLATAHLNSSMLQPAGTMCSGAINTAMRRSCVAAIKGGARSRLFAGVARAAVGPTARAGGARSAGAVQWRWAQHPIHGQCWGWQHGQQQHIMCTIRAAGKLLIPWQCCSCRCCCWYRLCCHNACTLRALPGESAVGGNLCLHFLLSQLYRQQSSVTAQSCW